jgi:hypothetical protein
MALDNTTAESITLTLGESIGGLEGIMRATSEQLPEEMRAGEVETHGDDWGDLRMRHIHLPAGTDFRPLLAGLPDDLCQCPHWGYVIDGAITVRFGDGTEETVRAGEMYHWPAGHTGWTDEGVTFIELSPTKEIAEVMAHLAAAMSR